MAYLTEARLRSTYQRSINTSDAILSMNKSFSKLNITTMFLSHSHLDKDLVKGFIRELADLNIVVYVDWNDSNMPDRTSRETAEKIKNRIKQNQLFVVFATENALASRWVPWEIGIADQAKSLNQIFIMPITKNNNFNGNEYLQLYNRIELSNSGSYAVFKPNEINGFLLKSIISTGRLYG